MKKTIIGFISLVALGVLLQFGLRAHGGDDACGGCPKGFACDLTTLKCVPEQPAPHP